MSFVLAAAPAAGLVLCSDELFRVYRSFNDYPKTEFKARTDYAEDVTKYTKLENVSFNAAYYV